MKRSTVLACLVIAFVAACGRNQVVVEVALGDPETGEAQVLPNLPIRLLPYDRDAIFDSLEAAYAEPEPTIPADLLAQQQEIQTAERQWRTTEDRWATARDSALALYNELARMDGQGLRATPQYRQRHQQFERLERDARTFEQRSREAFQRYDGLTQAFITRADSIRIVREQWADRAFADFDRAVNDMLRRTRREELADTTDANGAARFRGVSQGRWWAHARYTQLFEELYWNVPVEVGSDSAGVVLTRENAQVRPAGM